MTLDICRKSIGQYPAEAAPVALLELLAKIGPEPIGEWMRGNGFPPESCILVLPESMRSLLAHPPRYVHFSPFIQAPTLLRDLTATW